VELLVALAVAAVLFGFAIPGFADFLQRQRTIAAVNQLIGAVHFARHAAVTQRAITTLCPADEESCARRNEWHLGALIFKDSNGNGVREPQEQVMGRFPPLRAGEHVQWRSFRNRSYLQFRSSGLTNWQNGSFHYCPANGDPRFAKVVIINAQGRVALSRDSNADGIDEDASGQPLRCG